MCFCSFVFPATFTQITPPENEVHILFPFELLRKHRHSHRFNIRGSCCKLVQQNRLTIVSIRHWIINIDRRAPRERRIPIESEPGPSDCCVRLNGFFFHEFTTARLSESMLHCKACPSPILPRRRSSPIFGYVVTDSQNVLCTTQQFPLLVSNLLLLAEAKTHAMWLQCVCKR